MFHVYLLNMCIVGPESIPHTEDLSVYENLSYEEVPIKKFNRQVQKLRYNEMASVKVLWRNHLVEGASWEAEDKMKCRYPNLFVN